LDVLTKDENLDLHQYVKSGGYQLSGPSEHHHRNFPKK
jgi:hypothetical protein